MGLDQFATARRGQPTEVDGILEYPETRELAYWRKHPNLQGWMEDLWIRKGNWGDFNCVDLELDHRDLDLLEGDVRFDRLPPTTGFFFGEDADERYQDYTLEFIRAARQAIDDGYTVVYHPWW